jgi:ATP-dependent DNA ligase
MQQMASANRSPRRRDTEGKVRLGFHWDKSRLDSSWPAGIYTRIVVASRSLPRLLRALPASPAAKPPAGAGWLHEIKHDGFRMLVRRDAADVRLFTRNGHWTERFSTGRACTAGNILPDRW